MSRRLNENYYREDEKRRKKRERKDSFEYAVDSLKNGLAPVAIFIGIILLACVALAALICPLIYYGEQFTTFNVSNVTNEQYVYMINGSEHLNIKYESEKRTYEGTLIEITMVASRCWDSDNIIAIFLDLGNISYEK